MPEWLAIVLATLVIMLTIMGVLVMVFAFIAWRQGDSFPEALVVFSGQAMYGLVIVVALFAIGGLIFWFTTLVFAAFGIQTPL